MKTKTLIILTLSLVLLIAAAAVLYGLLEETFRMDLLATVPSETEPSETTAASQETEGTTEAPDYSAPDFTVTDRDGNSVKLSDFLGKPVILNFWASWCGPCKMEMPDFEEAYLEYGDRIHFVLVNLTDGSQETVESAAGYIDSQGYTFPIYFDTTYSAAMAYGVSGVPVTYFIDAEGNLVAWGQGALNAQALAQGIGMILPE